ncbi:DUF397 domain-containing protein [Streptomyces sp. SID4919]|uniref:DUF397 domain-containing protein n=1 Tax=Streptomyces TaxID=1883 RepID=UPI0008237835|nr:MULTISPECIES: DUF397 domain-containing protein [unclassified Streptomyces]MYY11931.1 DUF397 domain-containing protein [Streptomyces sp. SID4919]SCK13223.1 protein of unknown function [Streptomyces sp. AmelKG-E11A]
MKSRGTIHWIKSSYSDGDGANCVEWAPSDTVFDGVVPVRDSKSPESPGLLFQDAAWRCFIVGVKGEL